tara:strand:- start:3231 stop:3542 length:312 start_codon:yes stop_codon:yes gene_type:complete
MSKLKKSERRKKTVVDSQPTRKKIVQRKKLTKKLTPEQKAAKKKSLIKDIPKNIKERRLGASGNLGNIGAGVKGLYKAGKWMLKEYALGKAVEKIDKKISKKS